MVVLPGDGKEKYLNIYLGGPASRDEERDEAEY